MSSSTSRLATFVGASMFHGGAQAPPDRLVETVVTVLRDVERDLPNDDRNLLKLAVGVVAFYRLVGDVARGEVELDLRDEAIYDAVIAHLAKTS